MTGTQKKLLRGGDNVVGRMVAFVVGLMLMILGIAAGVTMVLLPLGIPAGLVGLFLVLGALFPRSLQRHRGRD